MIRATELEYWASLGNLERVAAALSANPDANVRGEGGYTAMHAAAENGHLEVLRLLLSRGGEVSPRTDDGTSPLDLAAGHPEVVALLRTLGAR